MARADTRRGVAAAQSPRMGKFIIGIIVGAVLILFLLVQCVQGLI
jgi:hypothetical protein